MKNNTKFLTQEFKPYVLALLGIILFSLLFSGITFEFWTQLSLSITILCLLAYIYDWDEMKLLFLNNNVNILSAIFLGIVLSMILYGMFAGFKLLAEYIFPFAHDQISSVYTLKDNVHSSYIILLMLFIIGPGEEIFWRGYVQRNLEKRFGFMGIAVSLFAYTGAHFASGNLMLIAAAAVCGAFWSLMFFHFRSIWLNIISHVLWDIAIFIIWPLQ